MGLSYSTDIVGKFCKSGAWQDLSQYIYRDKIDMNNIPGPVRNYTSYAGKQCTMPFLNDAYGIYYNKDMFAAQGITDPPKTLDELTADAKKLTVFNTDGSIKVAGFDPLFGYYENSAAHFAAMSGAKWLTDDGKSAIGGDPNWQTVLNWQKSLVDWFGYDKLTKFNASLGDEFSAQNAFQAGKVAINLDGEWRIAFIADQAKNLNYGVAPMPVAPTSRPVWRRLHHRQRHRHLPRFQEPGSRLGVHQVPDHQHRRRGQARQRHQERADHQGRRAELRRT